jgi:hypothetical protein
MKPQKFKLEVETVVLPESPKYSGKAYYVRKLSYLLSQAYEATIENGVVVKETAISTEDMPSTTIGTASKHLWNQLRGEK